MKSSLSPRNRPGFLCPALLLPVFAFAVHSHADDIRWRAGIGNWFTADNWDNWSRPDGRGGYQHVVPRAGDTVSIFNGGVAEIVGGAATAANLRIGHQPSGGSVALLDGGLTVGGECSIAAGGQLTQAGGINNTGTLRVDTDGTYLMSAGLLNISLIEDVVQGVFTQTGGTHAVPADLLVTYAGRYNLQGGTLSVPGTIRVVELGLLTLDGGTLNAGAIRIEQGPYFGAGRVFVRDARAGSGLNTHSITNQGVILLGVGASIGSPTMNYEQSGFAYLYVRVGGPDVAQLRVGHATLDDRVIDGRPQCILQLDAVDGYVPPVGQSFKVLSGAYTGKFWTQAFSFPFTWLDAYGDGCVHAYYSEFGGRSSDDDGIPDEWEAHGIPYIDSNCALQRLVLPNADRERADIFVEVDAMQDLEPVAYSDSALSARITSAGLVPTGTSLDMVVGAFLHPLDAPPGADNIFRLHIQIDETNLAPRVYDPAWHEFDLDKNGDCPRGPGHFGTPGERGTNPCNTNSTWSALRAAKAQVYRYCMFAHSQCRGCTSSGLAENDSIASGGNDFMITLGGWVPEGRDPKVQAGTFMHELGHTLGLKHGGGDDINWKPNYKSVMNYAWQVPHCEYLSSWRLDYSGQQLPSLSESALVEGVGVGGNYPGMQFPYSFQFFGPGRGAAATCSGRIGVPDFQDPTVLSPAPRWFGLKLADFGTHWVDWDANGLPDPSVTRAIINHFQVNTVPSADCLTDREVPPSTETLNGYVDWTHLRFDFRDSPFVADGMHPDCNSGSSEKELTLEMSRMLDTIRRACAVDINADGHLDADDLGDFITCYFSTPPCVLSEFNGDGTVNADDLGDFITAYFQGCP